MTSCLVTYEEDSHAAVCTADVLMQLYGHKAALIATIHR